MSSNPEKYGVVKEGIYDGNYDVNGKRGTLKSNYAINHRDPVPDYRGYDPNTKKTTVDGIFIHTSNQNGFAGEKSNTAISEGCLLISPRDWESFQDVMGKTQDFKVQIMRWGVEKVPLQGHTGEEVPGQFVVRPHLYQ
jgi:hypothetical protein